MHFSNPCSRARGFVLSPLPKLGTMGSKWGGARVIDSSTSFTNLLSTRYGRMATTECYPRPQYVELC
jgi:hypothetical protein